MNAQSIFQNLLPIFAVILSVIIHIGILGSVIFIIPTDPAPFKPGFVFLGSILGDEPFSDTAVKLDSSNNSYLLEIPVQTSLVHEAKKPYSHPSVEKTITSASENSPKPMPLKPHQEQDNLNRKDPLKELGIPLKATPYQPLQYNP
tara:strand:- start:147 stop:584 length:438 start_codon:yes stop_codon:yes gene_type:complete